MQLWRRRWGILDDVEEAEVGHTVRESEANSFHIKVGGELIRAEGGPCLSGPSFSLSSIVVERHQDQGNSYKSFHWELAYSFRG